MASDKARAFIQALVDGFEDGFPVEFDPFPDGQERLAEYLGYMFEGIERPVPGDHRFEALGMDASGGWFLVWHHDGAGEQAVVEFTTDGIARIPAHDLDAFADYLAAACRDYVEQEGHDYEEDELEALRARWPERFDGDAEQLMRDATERNPVLAAFLAEHFAW